MANEIVKFSYFQENLHSDEWNNVQMLERSRNSQRVNRVLYFSRTVLQEKFKLVDEYW